jgi:hypothetical protein
VIYLPVFRNGMKTDTVEQRRAAIEGWVAAPTRIGALLNDVAGVLTEGVDLHIEDAGASALLLDSDKERDHSSGAPLFHTTEEIRFGGRLWHLNYAATPEFAQWRYGYGHDHDCGGYDHEPVDLGCFAGPDIDAGAGAAAGASNDANAARLASALSGADREII